MGLQSQLNDVSSDSIPLLLVAVIATFVGHLRSSVFAFLHSLGLSHHRLDASPPPPHDDDDGSLIAAFGSGLAGLVVLADQLNLNRLFSYRYERVCGGGGATTETCVVCLSGLRYGDQVRMLDCRHVFHKRCFDGWLDHLNFNCPLCRATLVHGERVETTRRRVGGDLLHWFSLRTN